MSESDTEYPLGEFGEDDDRLYNDENQESFDSESPEWPEDHPDCFRCQRLYTENSGCGPAVTVERNNGIYSIHCGYGSVYDMEVFQVCAKDSWFESLDILTTKQLKDVSLCDVCMER